MSVLNLDPATRSILTKTVSIPDPLNPPAFIEKQVTTANPKYDQADPNSKAVIVSVQMVPDPQNPGKFVVSSFMCDLYGNPITPPNPGLLVFRDTITGNSFVQVSEKVPSGNTPADADRRTALLTLNPIHYASADGAVNGWFVPAPDFNGREGK